LICWLIWAQRRRGLTDLTSAALCMYLYCMYCIYCMYWLKFGGDYLSPSLTRQLQYFIPADPGSALGLVSFPSFYVCLLPYIFFLSRCNHIRYIEDNLEIRSPIENVQTNSLHNSDPASCWYQSGNCARGSSLPYRNDRFEPSS
jgi:hypothetical protein